MLAVMIIALALLALELTNILSYRVIKRRILKRQRWGLNICCGFSDGGGVNADIVRHKDVPNFVLVDDICRLPFRDEEFETVLCSHTMEHVDEPDRFFAELRRVGRSVTIVVPPLWDLFAMVNLWEHKWIFLSFRKEHTDGLPRRVRLPLSRRVQRLFGQRIDG